MRLGADVVLRIFLSHSSENNAEAVALRDWLEREGWKDEVFLDLDPKRGIAAGERWERRLNEAANRCEAVLFLVSRAWMASGWCRRELNLAHRLNKRLLGILIEDLTIADIPTDLTREWQIISLAAGRDHIVLRAVLPVTHEETHVTFSVEGLQRLKHGLEQAGLDPKYFVWPPPGRRMGSMSRASFGSSVATKMSCNNWIYNAGWPSVLRQPRGVDQPTPHQVARDHAPNWNKSFSFWLVKNREDLMDGTTSCPKCGKRLVPVVTISGRTDLQCITCDDPVVKWAESPLTAPEKPIVPERV